MYKQDSLGRNGSLEQAQTLNGALTIRKSVNRWGSETRYCGSFPDCFFVQSDLLWTRKGSRTNEKLQQTLDRTRFWIGSKISRLPIGAVKLRSVLVLIFAFSQKEIYNQRYNRPSLAAPIAKIHFVSYPVFEGTKDHTTE